MLCGGGGGGTEEAPGPRDRAAEGGSEGVKIATAKKISVTIFSSLSTWRMKPDLALAEVNEAAHDGDWRRPRRPPSSVTLHNRRGHALLVDAEHAPHLARPNATRPPRSSCGSRSRRVQL